MLTPGKASPVMPMPPKQGSASPYDVVSTIFTIPPEVSTELKQLREVVTQQQEEITQLQGRFTNAATSIDTQIQRLQQRAEKPLLEQIAEEVRTQFQQANWRKLLLPTTLIKVAYSAVSFLFFSKPTSSAVPRASAAEHRHLHQP